MTIEHIDALLPYERAMFGTEAWTRSSYQTELADPERRHYVAAIDADGALLGWAGVLVVADSAEILTVGVIPDARRQGTAIALLADLLTDARRRGAIEVFLEVRIDNDGAQRLYEHEGFTQISIRRGYYDQGRVDAVVMRRDL